MTPTDVCIGDVDRCSCVYKHIYSSLKFFRLLTVLQRVDLLESPKSLKNQAFLVANSRKYPYTW